MAKRIKKLRKFAVMFDQPNSFWVKPCARGGIDIASEFDHECIMDEDQVDGFLGGNVDSRYVKVAVDVTISRI